MDAVLGVFRNVCEGQGARSNTRNKIMMNREARWCACLEISSKEVHEIIRLHLQVLQYSSSDRISKTSALAIMVVFLLREHCGPVPAGEGSLSLS
mmetsp:Transcript_32442/g.65108  ORF Transcript_32442/g.65108 Transcript_32442/m.65108 type:complete len:95 (-) Transcript_32442:191-475(-)